MMAHKLVVLMFLCSSVASAEDAEPDPMDELIAVADKPPPAPKKPVPKGEIPPDLVWRGVNAPDRAHGQRVGAGLGFSSFGGNFLVVDPFFEFEADGFRIAVGAPVRLTLNDSANPDVKWAPRKQDWDEWRDYLKILRELYAGTEDTHLHIARITDFTLGHGGLVRRYNPNLFLNTPHVGALLEFKSDWVSGRVGLADVGLQSPVAMARVQAQPWAGDDVASQLESLHVGVSFVADAGAPVALHVDDAGVVAADRSGVAGADAQWLNAFGVDLGLSLVDVSVFKAAVYGEFNQILAAGYGGHVGLELSVKPSILEIRALGEYRNLGTRYFANYFDGFYDIQRLQFSGFTPKQVYLRDSLPGERGHGGYFEVGLAVGSYFAVAGALELSTRMGVPEQSLLGHMSLTPLKWLSAYGTVQQRSSSNIFSKGAAEPGQTLAAAGLHVMPVGWFAVNAQLSRLFSWGSGALVGTWTAGATAEFAYDF